MEVSLFDILQAREQRVLLQQKLLQKYRYPLICFTMNIAGPIKNTPLIQRGFRAGIDALQERLTKEALVHHSFDSDKTGNTAMLVVKADAADLKQLCVQIEETHPLGRLFDMDVMDITGKKLERSTQRSCLVCGAPGRTCAAGRVHSVELLQNVTNQMLTKYFLELDSEYIANCAVAALIDEVNTTPKPGLVDRRNSGSHKDMNLSHFIASAHALFPYFAKCVRIGHDTADAVPEDTFSLLRAEGIEAENAMFAATDGINTHKGAIYTLGILCGSIGRLWKPEKAVAKTDHLLEECSKIAHKAVETDFAKADGSTAGQTLYLKYGLKGIRGEIAAGLPSVSKIALPCYQRALNSGLSSNDAGVVTLMSLIANVQDTNLYHRGGMEGAKWAASAARELAATDYTHLLSQAEALDDAFIQKNLSPGGCADLLAVTHFVYLLNG